jgi:GNAT superfamily N-acetyltransferase
VSAHVWVAGTHEAGEVTRLMVGFRDHLGYDWPSQNAFRAGVEKLLADTQTDFLLGAKDPDSPAEGVCQLRFRHGLWRAGTDCLLEDLFVERPARGDGLGRALVARARERALERGARRMELDVNEANAAALKLYESFGFQTKRSGSDGGRDLYMRVHLPHA